MYEQISMSDEMRRADARYLRNAQGNGDAKNQGIRISRSVDLEAVLQCMWERHQTSHRCDSIPRHGIVQRYVSNPLLVHGYKFDLRLYVVVTSYCPLRVYLYDEGLVRLSTKKYSSKMKTARLREMHLTNYSIQKNSSAYVQNLDNSTLPSGVDAHRCGEPSSFKWSLHELEAYFNSQGIDYDAVFCRVRDLIVKSMIAVEANMEARSNCANFELYGFDVLIDNSLKPWLLEVNIMPSLSASSPLDKRVKTMLMCDTFTLIGLQHFNNREEHENQREAVVQRLLRPSSAGSARLGSTTGHPTVGDRLAPTAAEHREVVQNLPRRPSSAGPARPGSREVPLGRPVAALASDRPASAKGVRASWSSDRSAGFTDSEWASIQVTLEEYMRRGRFECVYPMCEPIGKYAALFASPCTANSVIDEWLRQGGIDLFTEEGRQKSSIPIPATVPLMSPGANSV
jgi:hypothetical protein